MQILILSGATASKLEVKDSRCSGKRPLPSYCSNAPRNLTSTNPLFALRCRAFFPPTSSASRRCSSLTLLQPSPVNKCFLSCLVNGLFHKCTFLLCCEGPPGCGAADLLCQMCYQAFTVRESEQRAGNRAAACQRTHCQPWLQSSRTDGKEKDQQ